MATANFLNEPIVCDLGVFSSEERAEHLALSGKIFAKCKGFKEIETGIELAFDGALAESELRKWYTNESKCCRFAAYNLVFKEGEWSLNVSTNPEGRSYLRQAYAWILGGKIAPLAQTNNVAGFFKFGGVLAAVLCMACLLPLFGGFLVARGFIGSFWNPGELAWIGFGLAILGVWFAISRIKKRKRKADAACAC